MDDSLHLRRLGALSDLRGAIASFSEKSQENMASVQTELQRTLEWIDERVWHWRSEVERAEERVEEAENDLRQRERESEDSDDMDGYGHYGDEQEVLEEAKQQLEECRENLETAERWKLSMEGAVDEYYREMSCFYVLVNDHTDKAKIFLEDKLEKYSLVHGNSENPINTAPTNSILLSSLTVYSLNDNNRYEAIRKMPGYKKVQERHGAHIKDEALDYRVKTGVAPDGKFSPAPASTRFSSQQELDRTLLATLDYFIEVEGIDFSKPPEPDQESGPPPIVIDHGRAIDEGYVGLGAKTEIIDPNNPNKRAAAHINTVRVEGLTRTRTTIIWDKEKCHWEIAQHFPEADRWDQDTKSYLQD